MLTKEFVLETIKEVLDKEVALDTTFQELNLDSTVKLEILIEFEVALNIDILDEDMNLDDFKNMNDVYNYLQTITTNRC